MYSYLFSSSPNVGLTKPTVSVLLFSTLQIEIEAVYGLSELEIGLAYVPFGVGACLGTVVGGRMADYCAAHYGAGGRLIPTTIGILASPSLSLSFLHFCCVHEHLSFSKKNTHTNITGSVAITLGIAGFGWTRMN